MEHACILAGGRFDPDRITKFAARENGSVDLEELEKVLAHHDHSTGAPLVCVMLANNETGVIQPIAEVSKIVLANNGYLCVDAVQAFGKFAIDFPALGAHFVLLSGHKIGGPKGVGALLRMDEAILPQPLIHGGGQENLARAGTENVAAIAGFGAAIAVTTKNLDDRRSVSLLREHIEHGLEKISRQSGNKIPLPVFFGKSQPRLDNTSCFAVEGFKAETALIALDLKGISVSSGSACSSGKVNQSHVLNAMGVSPDLAECTLRVSIGRQTSSDEADHFLSAWENIMEQ
jgi:cysteine desulfurase